MHLIFIIFGLGCIAMTQSTPMLPESGLARAAIGLGEEMVESAISHAHLKNPSSHALESDFQSLDDLSTNEEFQNFLSVFTEEPSSDHLAVNEGMASTLSSKESSHLNSISSTHSFPFGDTVPHSRVVTTDPFRDRVVTSDQSVGNPLHRITSALAVKHAQTVTSHQFTENPLHSARTTSLSPTMILVEDPLHFEPNTPRSQTITSEQSLEDPLASVPSVPRALRSDTITSDQSVDNTLELRPIDATGMTPEEYRAAMVKEKMRIRKAKYLAKLKSDPERYQKKQEYQREWFQKLKEDPEKYQKKMQLNKESKKRQRSSNNIQENSKQLRKKRQKSKNNDPDEYRKKVEADKARRKRYYEKLKNDPEKYQKFLEKQREFHRRRKMRE